MKRALLGAGGAVALAAACSIAADARYDGAAWATFKILAPTGAVTALAIGALVARGTLRRRALAAGAALLAQAATCVALFASQMFVSSHDAFFMGLVAVYSTALGATAAWLLSRRALRDLDAVRVTLAAVGEGRRDVTTGVRGNGELRRLADDVDAMVARLDREERARRSLVAAVSHDLRTPITSLRLLADAIEDGVVDGPTGQEYAKRMSVHVLTLSALIDDLFELSRLESGDLHWTVEQVQLDALVHEAVDAMRPAADAGAITVTADLQPATAQANADQMQRVLFNLIQNAIRHTPQDGSITIRAWRDGPRAAVEVADSGSGIAPADRERVFEPFFRGGDDTARATDGAGLGLAIARAIVEAHGGRMWLAEAERGTAVRFALPSAG